MFYQRTLAGQPGQPLPGLTCIVFGVERHGIDSIALANQLLLALNTHRTLANDSMRLTNIRKSFRVLDKGEASPNECPIVPMMSMLAHTHHRTVDALELTAQC